MPMFSSLLFDRDGTLIKDKHYLAEADGVELLPHVGKVLAAFARQGIRFFLVSNQSGVGRGMFPREAVLICNERLAALLAPYGVHFTDMLFCPHTPDDACLCRKPAIGMWRVLEDRYAVKAEECVMVGDKEEDMRFAAQAGFSWRVLVLTGKGKSTAAHLGLSVPTAPIQVELNPKSAGHPHLTIPDLSWLEHGLALLYR